VAGLPPVVAESTSQVRDTSVRVWRLSLVTWSILLAVGVLAYQAYAGALNILWGGWQLRPEWSHGVLLPLITVFLVWQQRDRLERLPFVGSWWGVVGVLAAGALWCVGELAGVYTIDQYAFVLSIAGLVLALTGWRAFALLRGPLVILFLMVPMPAFFMSNLSLKLQVLSSHLGVLFVRLFGISVFVEGNVIDLGAYKLQVAEACDGLRYLLPLMTIGFIMAYFYRAAMWKRVAIVLSSIPLTILMNSIRIGVIGVTVEYWGIEMAEGFLHEFQGWLVFMITSAMMFGEIVALSGKGVAWRDLLSIDLPPPTPRGAMIQRRNLPAPLFVAAAVLVAQLWAASLLPQRPEIIPSRSAFTQFPTTLQGRNAHPVTMEQVYADALKLDDYLLADYVGATRPPVNLYIAYYNSQRKGESVHSPRSCLPGGGWQMREFGQHEFPGVSYNGHALRVNRAVIELGDQRELVYYWFVQRGRIITNEFVVKWYLFWDALTRQRTDGALVRLVEPLRRGESTAQADMDLGAFAEAVSEPMPQFVRN
jgi:exosortase D (VPLPA-CTERM-specific)